MCAICVCTSVCRLLQRMLWMSTSSTGCCYGNSTEGILPQLTVGTCTLLSSPDDCECGRVECGMVVWESGAWEGGVWESGAGRVECGRVECGRVEWENGVGG